MVYRHLHCATFTPEIECAEDVENYEALSPEDYVKLAEQVDASKTRIEEERREVRPDELVQKAFDGEIRTEPPGFVGSLLPFQVEGFSWMRSQETTQKIRGGILADEMGESLRSIIPFYGFRISDLWFARHAILLGGPDLLIRIIYVLSYLPKKQITGMGKTIQTIAAILDRRPKLQHATPGMKHPPTGDDIEERHAEEDLWDETKRDWTNEMDLLKVSRKLRSRDGGARAGTLVICPVIALSQWRSEIEKFTEGGTLSVCTYHGPDREGKTPREMMKKYDVVLTTYQGES